MTGDLLGRSTELAALEALLEEARDGAKRVALVSGDPGIGKTTLLEALADRASEAGFGVAWGRCWEASGTPPYWPWRQVLRSGLDSADDFVSSKETDDEDDRSRRFDQVVERLLAGAGEGLLIALEDLHAADEGSLALLRFIARLDTPARLLVVGTYRVAEVARSAPHQLALSAVARHGPTIRLAGLGRHDVAALLERTGLAPEERQVDHLHRLSDGNPFLVHEAARLVRDGMDTDLPADAGSVVRARLSGLDDGLLALLRAAAVIGREFDLAVLSQLVGRAPDDVLNPLARAERLLVLDEVGLARWSFAHSLLREALLDEIGDDERRALHCRVGEVFESLHGEDGVAAELAYHYDKGGHPRASEACARAGFRANATAAFEDAARWFGRALDNLTDRGGADERLRYDLLLALGDAWLRAGDETAAKDAHHRAIRAARAVGSGSVELAAEAAVRMAPFSVSDSMVISALDDALCDLPPEPSALRARVLTAFASVLARSSIDRNVLRDVSRQGRDMARLVGDRHTLRAVLWRWHRDAMGASDLIEERLDVVEELLALAEHDRDPEDLIQARHARAEVLFDAGQFDAARRDAEICLGALQQEKRRRGTFAALMLLAGVALVQGRLDEAEALTAQAATAANHLDGVEEEAAAHQFLMAVRRQQGRFEEVERLGQEAAVRWLSSSLDCLRQIPLVHAVAELGRDDEARDLLDQLVGDKVVELSEGMIVPDIGWVAAPRLCCPTALGEVCSLLGDRARAALLYDRLLPAAELPVANAPHFRGVVARYLGIVAAAVGRLDEADTHFQTAHRLHDAMGARLWSAHGRLDHGRMLLQRDRPGDRQRAGELIAEARDRFGELGMDFYRRRAAALLESARDASTTASLHEEGGVWTFTFGGRQAHLRDGKGVRFLVRLLRDPGREFHALDLLGGGLDAGAVAAARARLTELRDELDEAAMNSDLERTHRAQDALDRFLAQLTRSGRGGENGAERARQSVTRAVKGAVDRLHAAHPDLGEHLRSTLRIGITSAYVPDPRAPVRWEDRP